MLQETDDGLGCRRLSSIMVSRLGTMDIAELLLRPGSETSLPPIHKVKAMLMVFGVKYIVHPQIAVGRGLSR